MWGGSKMRETHTERKTFHYSKWRVWVYEQLIKACCLCSIVHFLRVCSKAQHHTKTKTSAKEWPPLLATISHPPTPCSTSVPLSFCLCSFLVFLWGGVKTESFQSQCLCVIAAAVESVKDSVLFFDYATSVVSIWCWLLILSVIAFKDVLLIWVPV